MPSQFLRYWGCGSHAEPKPRQSDLTALRVGGSYIFGGPEWWEY